jgi:hypothetical protein
MFANAVMLQNFDNTSELRVSVPERLPLAQDYSSWKRFRLEAFLRRAECYDLQRKLNHEVGQPTCVGHRAPGVARGAECSNGHGGGYFAKKTVFENVTVITALIYSKPPPKVTPLIK